MHAPVTADQRASPVDELLEESWGDRGRPLPGRELKIEFLVTAAFIAAVTALVLLSPDMTWSHPAVAAALVVGYALAARVEFPVGAAVFSPTQLILVPLFAMAPAQLVPMLVFCGLLLSSVVAAATGRSRADRMIFCGGDSLHSLGPALVFVVFAGGNAPEAAAGVMLLALIAQFAGDYVSSSLHELLVMGVNPDVHVRLLGGVWAVDSVLTSVGVLAASVAQSSAWAALVPLPLVGLLGAMAADRTRKVEAAHDRLRELQRERARMRMVVRRLGEAFASNLDADALQSIMTGAVAEALDGDVVRARARGAAGETITRELSKHERAAALAALSLAEHQFASGGDCGLADASGFFALAGRIGSPGERVGMVSVARVRPFSDDEQDLFVYLCEQASIAAANSSRHQALQIAEARMRHQAFHDPLTGLANRARFAERVDRVLANDDTGGAAVFFIDLDGFKQVNDSHGHETGDELLVVLAERLAGCLRDGDTAARLGGDEFAVLIEHGIDATEAAVQTADRLREALSAPVTLGDREISVGASVGIAEIAPGIGREEIMRRADAAMYSAKHGGGRRSMTFDASLPPGRHGSSVGALGLHVVAEQRAS